MRFVTLAHPATHGNISDILCAVRKSLFLGILVVAWSVFAFHRASAAVAQQTQTPPAPPVEASPPSQTPAANAPAPPPAPTPPVPASPVIVIDPAHGGTDAGARGENAIEKDIALQLARSIRAVLERQGYRVVMTRNDDSNPSYDDRDATANAYRDAIFI